MKFSLNPKTSLQQVCQSAILKPMTSHFVALSFFTENLNLHAKINKMVNKYSVDYHPIPLSSKMYILSYFYKPIKVYISPEYFLNFLSNLYMGEIIFFCAMSPPQQSSKPIFQIRVL